MSRRGAPWGNNDISVINKSVSNFKDTFWYPFILLGGAVTWLKELLVGFSSLSPGVKARAVDVGFMGDKMSVGQIFRQALQFLAVSILPPMFYTHSCICQ